MKLQYIYMQGCGACTAAKPELAKFKKAHPEIEVTMLDTLNDKWNDTWEVQATPTYVLTFDQPHQRTRYEGALKASDIEKFIAKSKQVLGVR